MQKKLAYTMLITSLGLMMVFFQNCGVYRSSDREDFNQNGVEQSQTESKSSPPTAAKSALHAKDCGNLISEAEADQAFSLPTELIPARDTNDDPACMISTFSNDSLGSNSAVCSWSMANWREMQVAPTEVIWPDPNPESILPEGSFARVLVLTNGQAKLQFMGAVLKDKPAVRCEFTYSSKRELELDLSRGLLRASSLVHAIARRIN